MDEDLKEINRPGFVNREWLFDLHWYTEQEEVNEGEDIPYFSVERLPLAVECEWNLNKKKGVFRGEIKYDFQKLVVTNAELRLMIFQIKDVDDLVKLGNYFENVIKSYKHIENNAQFLFVAFDYKKECFYFKEIIARQKTKQFGTSS